MQLINSIVSWFNIKRLHQIELFKQYPFNVQEETLYKLIQKAKDTEWGKKFDYERIQTVEDFQKNIPLQSYEEIKPYVSRLREGEPNLLWPGEIKWFAKSSGTTSDKSKFIPVSKETLEDCHFRGGKDIMALYTYHHPNTKVFSGKGLTLGGSHTIDNFSNQSYYGDLSAILIENLPWWVDIIRTPKTEIALLGKWEEKLERITQTTIRENVTNIAGVPSWNLVLIKHILAQTGKNNLLDVWPNLELFTHGGVSFAPYRDQFKKIIPSDQMNYMEAYNASEGFFAIQDDPASDDMLLMLDYGIFYEFIPMEEFHKPYPRAVTVNNVEPGKNYAMVITTNSGLWRYIIGDTITFTSIFPHKLKITGRTRNFINAFGEEIIIDNAEKALQIACEKTHTSIREYTAGPIFMGDNSNGAHEWLIEFEQEPENLDYFTTLLDNALCSLNSDYEAKRYQNITLRMPVVRKMRPGVFFEWMKNKGKLGGQNKVPRLANERTYIEEILALNTQI
ncbi:MAG TPA: GH3 auxin-responsive promoter family protein [Bacteroidales bacterium]